MDLDKEGLDLCHFVGFGKHYDVTNVSGWFDFEVEQYVFDDFGEEVILWVKLTGATEEVREELFRRRCAKRI